MTSTRKTKLGYCPTCHKNVPHQRWFATAFFGRLNMIYSKLCRLLRIGPWYCVHCDHKVMFLTFPKSNAPLYRESELRTDIKPAVPKSKRTPDQPQPAETIAETVVETPTAIPVGNFIKTEASLVMKSKRLNRFSEKYRDAVVRRILSGSTTLSQVREDKQLSEGEITDWIADLFNRQQAKIDGLTSGTASGYLENATSELSDKESTTYPARPR